MSFWKSSFILYFKGINQTNTTPINHYDEIKYQTLFANDRVKKYVKGKLDLKMGVKNWPRVRDDMFEIVRDQDDRFDPFRAHDLPSLKRNLSLPMFPNKHDLTDYKLSEPKVDQPVAKTQNPSNPINSTTKPRDPRVPRRKGSLNDRRETFYNTTLLGTSSPSLTIFP